MASEFAQFHIALRRYHAWAALWKACLFGAIGYVFVSNEISTAQLIRGCFVAGALAAVTEYFWLYRPNVKRHLELAERFGEAYERKLREAITEIGYSKIVSTFWLSRCYDQMNRQKES